MQFLQDALNERLQSAAEILDRHPKFRIITHYDADGISAAIVLGRTLMKSKKGFHTTFASSFPKDIPGGLPVIFTDVGNSYLKEISSIKEDTIVLDHHKVTGETDPGENKVFINPHDFGIDGSRELSGGTMAFLLSMAYDETNWAKAFYGLAGAAADKQNIGGFTGVNKSILENAMEKKKIRSRKGLYLDGSGIRDALLKSCDPYFPGISGRESVIDDILRDLDIDPEAPVNELSKEKDRKLSSLLVLSLLERKIPPGTIRSIKGERYYHPEHDMDIDLLYKLLNACARVSRPGLGMSIGLGDHTALETAMELREDYRTDMIKRLHIMEDKGIEELSNVQYFYEERKTRKGELAGLGMLYFLNQDKPAFGISIQDKDADISCRGTRDHVERGLDLGLICGEICSQLEGSGGGHDIAAGATIPKDRVEEFLEMANQRVGEMLER